MCDGYDKTFGFSNFVENRIWEVRQQVPANFPFSLILRLGESPGMSLDCKKCFGRFWRETGDPCCTWTILIPLGRGYQLRFGCRVYAKNHGEVGLESEACVRSIDFRQSTDASSPLSIACKRVSISASHAESASASTSGGLQTQNELPGQLRPVVSR